jgi:hypothetical protein
MSRASVLWDTKVTNFLQSVQANTGSQYSPVPDVSIVNKRFDVYPYHSELNHLHRFNRDFIRGDLVKWLYNKSMILYCYVKWSRLNVISGFWIVAFVSINDTIEELLNLNLTDYHVGRKLPLLNYYRCEYHPDCLGRLFKEPIPHINRTTADDPRFSFQAGDPKNHILDFIEMLYINHFNDDDTWTDWAKDVCEDANLLRDFNEVSTLYSGNDILSLTGTHKQALEDVKKALQAEKQRLFPWKLAVQNTATLSYS